MRCGLLWTDQELLASGVQRTRLLVPRVREHFIAQYGIDVLV